MACQTSTEKETVPLVATRGGRNAAGQYRADGTWAVNHMAPDDNDPFGVSFTPTDVSKATLEVRMGFVRQVYGILSVQLLLTALVAAPFQLVETQWLVENVWLMWISMVVTMATVCAISCIPNLARTHPWNEIILITLTVFEGVMVGFFSARYTWQSVLMAVGVTVFVVLGLTAYAFFAKTDFTGMGPYLFGALLVMVIFGFILCLLGLFGIQVDFLIVLFDIIGVLLFVFYIIYDTQLILGEWGGHKNSFSIEDYVFAALSLYLDIINLFLHILSLMGHNKGAGVDDY